MASPWTKVRERFFPSQSQNQWGKVWQGGLPKRTENLNAINPAGKIPRSRSGVRQGEKTLQPSVQLDYSDTYRENDALDGDLEEQLDGLKRVEKRQLLEKSEQLKQIRKQVEVITRLQEAVKARKPGSSARLVSSRSSRGSFFYGQPTTPGANSGVSPTSAPNGRRRVNGAALNRQPSRRKLPSSSAQDAADGNDPSDVDFGQVAQATRAQMRIAAEREKYSAKSLFNQRRPKTALGIYSAGADSNVAAPQRRFFAGPPVTGNGTSAAGAQDEFKDNDDDRESVDSEDSEAISRRIISVEISNGYEYGKSSNAHDNRPFSSRGRQSPSNQGNSYGGKNGQRNCTPTPKNNATPPPHDSERRPSKGILRPTTAFGQNHVGNNNPSEVHAASLAPVGRGNVTKIRPRTALGLVPTAGDQHSEGGTAPPSARRRSRSRRELELLCRMMDQDEEVGGVGAGGNGAIISGDTTEEWEVINEKKRRRRLRALRQEGQRLEVRVKDFLSEIDGFNKRQAAVNSSTATGRKKSTAGLALLISDLE